MSVSNFPRNDVGLPSDIIWTDVTGVKFNPRQVPTFTAFARGVCIFGANFGDEGKGKEVDSKAMEYKRLGYKVLSARGQGSGNAGHTVKVDGKSYDFHYLTSAGLLADLMLLGPGMLIDPIRVLKEMEKLPEKQKSNNLHQLRALRRCMGRCQTERCGLRSNWHNRIWCWSRRCFPWFPLPCNLC